jgi:hypothetical protein
MMRKATKTVSLSLGVLSGIAAMVHGYFEILQGNTRPPSLVFASWGANICDPALLWHACEPAMSILPDFLATGILTIIISLAVIVWSVRFIHGKYGGLGLIMLSIILLLFGGGFIPPLIGLIGGAAGTQINRPLAGNPGTLTRLAARLWPFPLVLLITWLFAQFPIGYFFNDILKSIMGWVMLFIITFLPLSVYTGYARDAVQK